MAEQRQKTVVRYYRFKNSLKEKCGGLGGGTPEIPKEALEQAEQALEKLAEDYPDWVSNLIVKLQTQHGRCVDTPERRHEYFEEINRIAHDMKGQGGTFGYPLITTFADSLYGFTNIKDNITDNHVELVKSHIDAMRVVIKDRVSGSGGEIGKKLTESLNEAIEKYKVD